MNSKDATKNNRDKVRELVENAQMHVPGVYTFNDALGTLIYVDCNNGYSGKLVSVINPDGTSTYIPYWNEDGDSSSKMNGYVYTPIAVVRDNGVIEKVMYGTHSLVAMLAFKSDYDELDEKGLYPICNHKNNKSWDNRKENLEWTTSFGNLRHGNIISGLHHFFDGQFTHIACNCSPRDFVVLNEGLSVTNIEQYAREVGNKDVFKCAKFDHINPDTLCMFVEWLIDNGIWHRKTI